ncbi:MAG: four helix bundle protein [Cyanobacteriota bacterium]|nr:four helix bundle protein [Cyanobacteriota bacterium]
MGRPDFEDLEVYRLSEKLANEVWEMATTWDIFAKDTLGKQLVRAADSVCANIAEGKGRWHFKDNQRFIRIARGSLYETMSLLRLAYSRNLINSQRLDRIKPLLDELPPKLNAYLKSLNR